MRNKSSYTIDMNGCRYMWNDIVDTYLLDERGVIGLFGVPGALRGVGGGTSFSLLSESIRLLSPP